MTTKAPSKQAMAEAFDVCEQVLPHHDPLQAGKCRECHIIAAALEAFAAPVNNHIRLTYESERDAAVTFKADRDALRDRNRALVALAHTVADKYDIYGTESFIDIAKAGYVTRPATKHARLELSEAVDAMLTALAADAKAGEDRDGNNK